MLLNFQPAARDWSVGDRVVICTPGNATLGTDSRVIEVTDTVVVVGVPHYKTPCRFKRSDSTPSRKTGNFGALGIITEAEARDLMARYEAGERVMINPEFPSLFVGQGGI